jgi:drug/metabolite transporter (DMT)-like permease
MKPLGGIALRLRGYAALYSAATLFAFVSLFVKLASRYYSGLFVSASRFAIGLVLCIVVLFRHYGGVRPARPGLVAMRGLAGAASMAMSYAAISMTGPGRATLLSNTYPLFVAIFGVIAFGEPFKPRTLACVAICSAGALLVVRDGSGAAIAGDLLAVGSAIFAGFAINVVRKASQFDNPFMLYLSPCFFGLPLFAFAPIPASSGGLVGISLLLGVGVLGFLAQAFMAYGYKSVPASSGSVVFYWETALTVLLGLLFAGERFTLRFAAGLALILAGLWLNGMRGIRAGRSGTS